MKLYWRRDKVVQGVEASHPVTQAERDQLAARLSRMAIAIQNGDEEKPSSVPMNDDIVNVAWIVKDADGVLGRMVYTGSFEDEARS